MSRRKKESKNKKVYNIMYYVVYTLLFIIKVGQLFLSSIYIYIYRKKKKPCGERKLNLTVKRHK